MHRKEGLTRRQLLKLAAMSSPLLGLGSLARARQRGPGHHLTKNVVLFMTDQERAIQHFPANWEKDNLPGTTRLKKHGLTFENAFTNACMCSPARSTWMSGYFPAQHGVKYTLEDNMSPPRNPQVVLPLNLANIASVMSAAGYNVVYKGKWHCSKPAGMTWVPADVGQYGFTGWDPPDGGANQDVSQGGGAPTQPWANGNNDDRFINDNGAWQNGEEGALAFLTSRAAAQQPFFLIVSLVNPHDVLFYPSDKFQQAGYDDSWLAGDIRLPATVGEDLATKPTAQQEILNILRGLGLLPTRQKKRNYLNFYGNLMKSSDNYLVKILDTLDQEGLTNDTLIIKTADHGEMGLAHGGLRQKNFVFYEEAIRVPLVYSNPELYPDPLQSSALVSHVDFLPTLASLFSAPESARAKWQGIDYSDLVLDPAAQPVQDYIVFTYDDYQSGQPTRPYPKPPNHIVSIREERYKLAEYYDVHGVVPSQWEMYDLATDPLETINLAYQGCQRTPQQQREYKRLMRKLRTVQATRLRPL
jgi:choline-sulfatase